MVWLSGESKVITSIIEWVSNTDSCQATNQLKSKLLLSLARMHVVITAAIYQYLSSESQAHLRRLDVGRDI